MKKLFILFTGALMLASCNTAEKSPAEIPASSSEAQLQEEAADIQRAKQETIDSINLATIRQRTIDSMNHVAELKAVEKHPAIHHTPHHAAGVPVNPANPSVAPATTAQPVTSGNPEVTPATPEKKKGLNNAVKGALIGLGTGAAAGAIIDKDHRGKGAILGGIIGATGGAIGGAVIDKNKKKKAQQDSINKANGTNP